MNELAAELAVDVLEAPEFLEPALILRPQPGGRDADGFWTGTRWTPEEVYLSTVPMGTLGQVRLNQGQEGARDEETRSFWWAGELSAFHAGADKGDRIALGTLGPAPNTFHDDNSYAAAQALRDAQGAADMDWLAQYQADPDLLVLVTSNNSAVPFHWDPFTRGWYLRSLFQVQNAAPYGAFTEVLTERLTRGAYA